MGLKFTFTCNTQNFDLYKIYKLSFNKNMIESYKLNIDPILVHLHVDVHLYNAGKVRHKWAIIG